MRMFLVAAFVAALGGSAMAQTPTPAATEESAIGHLVVATLAPVSYGARAYDWDAVSIRISSHMHWHLAPPDRRDRSLKALVSRNGWIGDGLDVAVTAHGDDEGVRTLWFRYGARTGGPGGADKLGEALRAQGAAVEVRQSPSMLAAYTITPPGRHAALLAVRQHCTSPQSAAAQRCWLEAVLTPLANSGAPQ